jgi:hypothetical protein
MAGSKPSDAIGRAIAGGLLGFVGGTLLLMLGGTGILIWWISEGFPSPAPLGQIFPFASMYILGATGSGVIGGLLFARAATRVGAVLVGVMALQPFLWGLSRISQLWYGPSGTSEFLVTWLIMSLTLGPVSDLLGFAPTTGFNTG